MSQYSTGTASVTNGSPTVTGTNTLWLANVSAGDSFTVAGDGVMYDVASVDSDTQITLSVNYAGATASGVVYTIARDFTSPDNFPELTTGDIETPTIITRALRKIQSKFSGLVSDIGGKAEIAGQVFTGEIIYYGAGGISTNSSYGSQSLQSNTTGSLNTASGRSALRENTEGMANTAIGRSSNIFNETGSKNTTVGADSLRDNVSGDINTVVGKSSGRGITTGSGNSILGANVQGLASNLTNNLILSSGGVTRLQHDGVGTTAVQGDLVADGILFGTDTAAANTLDDYEEGTWTPEFRGSATAGTYSYAARVGKYVKTGASVTVWVTMFNIIESVSGAGDIQISGLPYAVSTDLSRGAIGAVVLEDFTFSGSISAVAESSGTILEFRESSTDSLDAVLQVSSRDGDGSDLFTCVTYTTDS